MNNDFVGNVAQIKYDSFLERITDQLWEIIALDLNTFVTTFFPLYEPIEISKSLEFSLNTFFFLAVLVVWLPLVYFNEIVIYVNCA